MSSLEDDSPDDEVIFLTLDQIKYLHTKSIDQYSPGESLTIRDAGLLESAVMAPQQTFEGEYLYHSLVDMASAYLIGLVSNHAFENGNKRVAFAACSTFLRINGYLLTFTQEEAEDITLRLAKHELSREDVVDRLNDAIDII